MALWWNVSAHFVKRQEWRVDGVLISEAAAAEVNSNFSSRGNGAEMDESQQQSSPTEAKPNS